MKETKVLCAAAFAAVIASQPVPALAHHSAAMFDMTKTVTVSGTVKQWQFVNPHSWLQVMSTDADGKQVQWSFEGASPAGGGTSPASQLRRDTFKPGDKITIVTHPMKDGRPAGILGEVTFADGHKWVPRMGPAPAAAPPPGGVPTPAGTTAPAGSAAPGGAPVSGSTPPPGTGR